VQGVSNEDELIKLVVENQRWSGFSRVNQISTKKISPDIDFLRIGEFVPKATFGYEFKLLRFRKDWNKINLMPMYTGIGEALHYFQFGIDQSYLVLGIPSGISSEAFSEALSRIGELKFTLNTFQMEGVKCLGLHLWLDDGKKFDTMLTPTKNLPLTEDVKHLKECLLRGQFKYHRQFQSGVPK